MPYPGRNKLLLFGSQIQYLLKATFTPDIAAPLAASLPVDIGTLTTVQTDGQFSQSGGKLMFPAQSTPAWGDQSFVSTALSRVAGRTLLAQFTLSSVNYFWIGFNDDATPASESAVLAGVWSQGSSFFSPILVNLNIGVFVAATAYEVAVVLRSTGYFLLVRGGIYTTWTLLWVYPTGTTATLYPAFGNYAAAGTLDNVRVLDLARYDARFATDTGLAVVSVAAPANATTYPATADFWGEYTVPFDGTATNFNYRQGDNNNCWRLLINTSGDVLLDERVAAVATTRASALATLTSGQTYRIIVVVEGNVHKVYKQLASTVTLLFTYTDGSNLYLTNTNLRYSSLQAGVTNLIVYPRRPSLPVGV